MKITKVIAKNYKAFPTLELELKSINLVIGKNGSGKSSLLRLLPLIIESLFKDLINLNPKGLDLAGRLSDLVFGHSSARPLSLGLEFQLDGGNHSFVTEIIYHTDYKKVTVLSFEYNDGSDLTIFKKILDNNSDTYTSNCCDDLILRFNGLIPELDFIDNAEVKDRLSIFYKLEREINYNYLSYLGPFRSKLNRVFPVRDNATVDIGYEGENTPFIMYEHERNHNSSYINEINEWMGMYMDKSSVEVKSETNSFSLYINKNNISSNIVDHGVGFSQVLPLIANRFNRKVRGIKGIELVEQPELHIHPAMCGSIVDLYLTSIAEFDNVVILETHSKETILRLRRRVAENKGGDLNESVQLIIVDQNDRGSFIDYINILDDGSCSWWPDGIFEEAYDEIIAIEEINSAN
jgi:AAA15 family ATPase/GTPase